MSVLVVVLAMLSCVGIAAVVVVAVAVAARREGRQVLTARGEDLVGVRDQD